ncbi:hypothetical protein Tco_1370520 [Tanacetum coccineum]
MRYSRSLLEKPSHDLRRKPHRDCHVMRDYSLRLPAPDVQKPRPPPPTQHPGIVYCNLQDYRLLTTTKYVVICDSQSSFLQYHDETRAALPYIAYPYSVSLHKEQVENCSQAVNKSPTHYPCDSARTFRVILFSIHNDEWKSFQCHHQTALRSYALSWKPCQGDSLNLPDHRIHKDGDGDASFQLKSDSLPHAHAQTTKTFYKHQDSRIMKAQELKTKTSAQTLIYKIFLQRYQVYQGRLLASFQDDAKYEHVGQDTRSQGGKDDQDGRIKI